jgi:hypothetical protein
MQESPRSFTARTSIAYAPPAHVTFLARPLGADEPCPTLFRYPGPCGLADWFAGTMTRLGPGELLWLADRPLWRDALGAGYFGTLAVLQPLRFHAAAHGPMVYVGENAALDPAHIVWLPPSALGRRVPWAALADAAAARPHLPADRAGERHRAIESLSRYLEELEGMRRSGAPGPGIPWCQIAAGERLRRLAAAGVAPVWSAGFGLYLLERPA